MSCQRGQVSRRVLKPPRRRSRSVGQQGLSQEHKNLVFNWTTDTHNGGQDNSTTDVLFDFVFVITKNGLKNT